VSEAAERPGLAGLRERTAPYRFLLRYARRNARGWLTIFLATLVATAVSLLTPWPMKVLVDQVLGSAGRDTVTRLLPGAHTGAGLLGWVVAAELVLFAAASALDVLLTVLWVRVGQGMVWQHAGDVFDAVQRRELAFHGRHDVGDTMERVTGDSWGVHTVVDSLLFEPLHNVLLTIGMIALMASLDPELTLVAVAVTPALAWASVRLGGRVRRAGELRRRVLGQLQALLHQSLTGMPVVQAFGQEDRVHHRFVELSGHAVRAERRTTLVDSVNGLLTGLVTTGGRGLVLLLGARRVLAGDLSVGSLLVFLAYVETLHAALSSFAGIYTALQGVRPQVDRVLEVLESVPEVADGSGALAVPVRGEVRLAGVGFAYEPGRPVLSDVSVVVRPGELVAVVGPTGAGKSTLAGLLVRFFDPTAGRVLLDGVDARDVPVGVWREQVGVVLQESFLFPLSIHDNIAYGRPGALREQVVAAARAANADEFVSRLPQGYDTVVGERGATLSGGQRQRVAIARALLKDAPVLVLDEPTSALDVQTEGLLLAALDRLMQGRTTLVIAHRLSTVRRADRIVVLDQGRVAETGTHEQLLRRGGLYAHLHALQADGTGPRKAAATDPADAADADTDVGRGEVGDQREAAELVAVEPNSG